MRHAATSGLAALLLTAMGGCGGSDDTPAAAKQQAADASVSVVASTNVYGDIARQIGGEKVKITSIIRDPEQDPHSYEANPQNQLALSKASVVIENGGGYDDFIDTMLKTADNPSVALLNVVQISGKTAPAGGELNEHVWYDLPTVALLADRLATALGKADPTDAATFTANANAFKTKLQPLQSKAAQIKTAHAGTAVAITEPVPGYLLQAAGLQDKTPEEFAEAIEEGNDVPPRALADTLALFTGKKVKALVYNAQTSGPQTEKVEKAAKDNGIAVVPVTETLPAGKDYLTWMDDNLTALNSALS
ncbi:metal ABC transporter solute-binding protein, Zn/Mn family [Actinomadura scrupuli]|uniref:metal ABC transporter solute-binding protein, Zn/Mn family n=1 Tax=Actinomadura scrupuli TaxID=559629 RepID=UPI003D95B693